MSDFRRVLEASKVRFHRFRNPRRRWSRPKQPSKVFLASFGVGGVSDQFGLAGVKDRYKEVRHSEALMNRFLTSYDTTPPWDIGRPQSAYLHVVDRGLVVSPVIDVGCGTGENGLYAAAHG